MKYLKETNLIIFICIVFLMTNVALSGYIVSRSFKAQKQRNHTEEYIKCIVLLRYDATPEQLATREGAVIALDKCAGQ